MAVLPDYVTGTITLANGSTTVTGTGTMFETAAFRPGDTLQIQNLTAIIASVDSNTSLTLTEPWTGTSLTDAPYRARYLPDGARVTAQTTTLIELLGNGVLSNIASVPVEDGKLLVGNASGQYEPISKDELGTPDPHGSLGKLAALTLAARQILQTDAAGDLKQVALAGGKALATDANGDVAPIDLDTLGRALLALASGATTEYVRGDGTLQPLNSLPFDMEIKKFAPNLKLSSTGGTNSYDINANISDSADGGVNIKRNGTNIINFGVGGVSLRTYGTAEIANNLTVGTSSNNSRIYMNNISNVRVAEIGPGVGTGNINILGFVNSTAGGFYFVGNSSFTGTLSKGGGTFLIDHPLDPFNKNLRHGFVEAPRYDLIYRGIVRLVNGRAMVDIDAASNMTSGTFAALTTNAVVTSLQNQEGFGRLKPGAINGGSFEVICEDVTCTDHVSWVVIAERNDPFVKSDLDQNTDSDGRFVPEFEKEDA